MQSWLTFSLIPRPPQVLSYLMYKLNLKVFFKTFNFILVCVCQLLSRVQLFATPRTVAHQASLSMEFSRQEYWSGLPFPSPRNFPTQGLNPGVLSHRQVLYHLSYREVLSLYWSIAN